MAFMEKPPAGKVLLDDTVPLTAQIEASQSLHSHTVRAAGRAAAPRGEGPGGSGAAGAALRRARGEEGSPGGAGPRGAGGSGCDGG